MLDLFSFHLISSHRSFSWNCLLIASHCHRSLCHPISSQLISSHVLSVFFTSSPHLIPSQVFSPLLSSSQAGHNCSLLFSCHLSFSHLFSSHLSLSQLFSNFHSSSQLFSALHSSCQLILCLLISSLLFSHLLSSSHISSADLSSCQLVSPHLSSAQRTLKSSQLFSGPKPAPNKDLGAKASDHCTFHREDLTQRTFTHSKLLHREACTHRSFYTETGTCTQRREAFTHNKLLHRASLYTASFLHTEAFAHRSFYTEQTFTHSKPLTHRSFYTQKLLHTEAFTQRSLLHSEDFTHSKLPHREAYTYTEKPVHKKI